MSTIAGRCSAPSPRENIVIGTSLPSNPRAVAAVMSEARQTLSRRSRISSRLSSSLSLSRLQKVHESTDNLKIAILIVPVAVDPVNGRP